MKTTLSKVSLINPVQFDNSELAMSTLITNEDWKIVSTFTGNNLGDVEIFKNTNYGKPDVAPVWKYYGSVPAAGVRGYRKANEPKAETDEPGQKAGGAKS